MTFEEKEKEYLDKDDAGEQFIEQATKQIKLIAKFKDDDVKRTKAHEALDGIIHGFAGKRVGE